MIPDVESFVRLLNHEGLSIGLFQIDLTYLSTTWKTYLDRASGVKVEIQPNALICIG
jgi:hypothetical protein